MREPIKTTPEELAALLTLCHENIRIADMTDARGIYDQYITKYGANLDPDYTAGRSAGNAVPHRVHTGTEERESQARRSRQAVHRWRTAGI